MSEPVRVLQVFAQMNRGGAETMIMNLYRNIDRSKVQFEFIVHTQEECDYDKEIAALGGRIYRIPRYRLLNHLTYVKVWKEFFETHKEYHIIHGHLISSAAIYLKIAKKYQLITIAHSHSTSAGTGAQGFIKNILQFPIKYIADYLFACSYVAGLWLYGRKAVQSDRFHIVKNAIETDQFIYNEHNRGKLRKEFNLNGKYVIGHVGRFYAVKNHEFLLEVFDKIHRENSNTVLLLVGRGELYSRIEDKIQKLNLSDSVILAGVREDVNLLYQAMDVFVFPSRYEGLGLAVIEAQAAGLPCIVADSIPSEAYITELVTALSLKDELKVWADQILTYSDGFERHNQYHSIVESGYDIKSTSHDIEEFYGSIQRL